MISDYNGRRSLWRGALLGSVSLVAMVCASGAEAACLGENTGNVLCHAANPATGGQLMTSSTADTTVTVNAGSGIAGAWGLVVSGGGSVTVNVNDPIGIGSSMFEAVRIYGSQSGAVTYTGSTDVIGPNGLSISTGGGPVSVTQSAGTITGIAVSTFAAPGDDGSITINTVGSHVADRGIFVRPLGTGVTDVTITTGDITATDYAIYLQGDLSSTPGRNVSVTTNGDVVGYIRLFTQATGTVDLTTKASVTGDIDIQASNAASTGAFTVNLNQDVTGDVSLRNAGSGTNTVRTRNIAGTFSVQGSGANSSVLVDGNITMGTVAATTVSGSVAGVYLPGGGTATFNGAISGTFDASASTSSSIGSGVTGLGVSLGRTTTTADTSATLTVNGPVTITGIAQPGRAAKVTGITVPVLTGGTGTFDINLHGAVTATSISDAASAVIGVTASDIGPNTLRLTTDGAVTATASAAGSTATGLSVSASEFLPSFTGPNTLVIRANGDVTATSDGAATGIALSRGSATSSSVTAGPGGADLVTRGTVTATSTSAAAIGVSGIFNNDATTAAALAIRTEGNVIASGAAATSFGILARRGGLGDLTIDVLAGVSSTGTGISATRTNAGNILITAENAATISGVTGIVTSGGTTTLVNQGSVTGTGGTAIRFGGTNDVLRMTPGAAVNGNVVGSGTSILQLGGTTAASFDLSKLSGFATITSFAGSTWSYTGTSSFAGTVNVDGALTLNSDMSAATVIVGAGGTLSGNGTFGSLIVNGTLSPGNSPGTITTASLTMTAASTYLVQVTGAISDRTIVTGTADITGQVVVDPLERLTRKTTYTILTAGTLNGTFASANLLVANNLARNPVLAYVGNDVLLTLDPGLLSPILSANASTNSRNVAGAIDGALLGGANLSTAFSAIFNLSGSALSSGLTQISGETATGAQQTTFNAMTQFMGTMLDPFLDGRGIAAGASGAPTPFADEQALAYAGKRSTNDAYAAIYRKAPIAGAYDPHWSVWTAAYGGSQTTSGNMATGSSYTTIRLFGTAVGFDYRFSPNTIAGFALAGGGTSFGVANGGSGRSDLFQAGAFVRHTIGPAYIAGALAYGWQDITTDRTVTVGGTDRLRGAFNANAYSGRIESGYRLIAPWIGGVGLTPYAAGQFTTVALPAYAEQAVGGANTFALAYTSKSVTIPRSEIGLRADKSFALDGAVLTLRGRAAWAHDFTRDRSIAATFQTLPGSSFTVNGAAQAANSALTTISTEVKWMNGWSALASFEGEFSSVTRSYAGKGAVRYAW